jgi:hypothetical protein
MGGAAVVAGLLDAASLHAPHWSTDQLGVTRLRPACAGWKGKRASHFIHYIHFHSLTPQIFRTSIHFPVVCNEFRRAS